MKRSLIIAPLLVVILAAAILFLGGPSREFTTTSSDAYDLFRDGYAQTNSFQFASAESSLTRAVEIDPDFAMARALLAGVLKRTFRADEADEQIAIADSLVQSLSNDVERAKVQLTLCGMSDGNKARRDSLLAYLVAEEPDNLLVLSAQATNAFDNDPETSEAIFQKILAIEPNYAPAYNMLGYLSANTGRYAEAESYLRKYVFLAPDLANPHDSLGDVLSWVGEYDEAEHEYLTALKIDPQFHYSLINLGRLYLDQGRLTKGQGILEKVRPFVSDTPEEQRIDRILIRSFYTWEIHDRSQAGIASYIERNPEEFSTGFYKALLMAIRGDSAAGRIQMDAFMSSAREDGAKYENERITRQIESLAYQYDAMEATFRDDHAAAIIAWTRFMDMRKEDTPLHEQWWVHWRLGQSQLAMGDGAAALMSARAAIDPNPNRIHPLMLLALAALDQGERGLAHDATMKLEPLIARADKDLPVQTAFLELKAKLDILAVR